MWTLDLLPEIESDLIVLCRIADPWSIPSSRFFSLAERMPYYDGAVRGALTRAAVAQQSQPTAPYLEAQPEVLTLEGSTLAALAGDDPSQIGIDYTS